MRLSFFASAIIFYAIKDMFSASHATCVLKGSLQRSYTDAITFY